MKKGQMDGILCQEAEEALVKVSKQESADGRNKSGLDGEEMRRLLSNISLVCDVLKVQVPGTSRLIPKSESIVTALTKMFALFDKAAEVVLSQWGYDRSDEAQQYLRDWRDHIHNSFGAHNSMPNGEDFCDCQPVHDMTEHFRDRAHLVYSMYGVPPSELTDQAGEGANQTVKCDISGGQGSVTNRHMSPEITVIEGQNAYTDNKWWLESHRLQRIFLKHNLKNVIYKKRSFKKCGRCGLSGHSKNQVDPKTKRKCPLHPRYIAAD